MKTSKAGIDLIKRFEGLELSAYQCSADVWTIGYGHTRGVSPGDTVTEAEAEALLVEDLAEFEKCVNGAVQTPITQGQFDALVSFAFNVGCAAFRKSTLLRELNDGNDMSAAQQFTRWNKAGGKVLSGLTKRRMAEMEMFLA